MNKVASFESRNKSRKSSPEVDKYGAFLKRVESVSSVENIVLSFNVSLIVWLLRLSKEGWWNGFIRLFLTVEVVKICVKMLMWK